MEIFKLFGSILVKDEEALKALDAVDKKGQQAGKSFDNMRKAGENLTKLGGKFTAFVTVPVAGLVGASINAYDNLARMQRKSKVVFGDMESDVASWSLSMEKQMGLGAGTIQGFATDIADLTQGFGMTKEASVDFSKEVTNNITALARWKGVNPSETAQAYQSALSGSTKALLSYGVSLDENTLNTVKNKMGIQGKWKELDKATRAQVINQAIMEASTNALEANNRENWSLADTINYVKEMFGNLMELLGGQFGATLQNVALQFGDILQELGLFLSENPKVVEGIAKILMALATLGPVMVIVGQAIVFIATLGAKITEAGGIGLFFKGILTTLGTTLSGIILPIIAVVAAIGLFVAALIDGYKNNEEFRKNVDSVFNSIKEVITNVMSIVKDVVTLAIQAFKFAWDNGLKQILQIVMTVLGSIVKFFSDKLNGALTVVKTVIDLIKAVFSGDFKAVENIVNTVLMKIVAGFNEKMEDAKKKVSNAIQKIKEFFNFKWELPKLKMPRINIKGKFSLNPISVPSFGIEWYKNGGIMMNPTQFGFNPGSGKAMVGGEAGPEAILPLSKIPELMKEMGYLNGGPGGDIIINLDGREITRVVSRRMAHNVNKF